MKTNENPKEESNQKGFNEMIAKTEAGKRIPKIFFIMLGVELSGIPKHARAVFEYPTSASDVADYSEGICTRMLLESVFSTILSDISAVKSLVPLLRTAIIAAQTGADGKVTDRNTAQGNLQDGMTDMLAAINKAARSLSDADAKSLFERLGVKLWSRQTSTKDEIEIVHGELTGSFDLFVRRPDCDFATLWEISTDQLNWKTADFSRKAHGYISGLTKGTTYYFRAMLSLPTGKTNWTKTVDIVCL